MKRRLRTLLLVVTAALVAVAIDRARADAVQRLHRVKEQSDVYALPPPEYLRRAAVGYDDAVASILWATTLYQYGDHVSQNRRFPYAVQYLQTVLHLDPAFRPAYRFASTLVTMQAVAPERWELDAVRSLLAHGTEYLPTDPDVWGAYASFLMFEGAQYLPPAEKQAWRVDGALAAERAVELGFFMSSLNYSGAIFLETAGHRELAIEQLERAYAMAPNDDTRRKIAARLERLQGAAMASRIAHAQTLFLERWRREAPFLDEGAFGLIGPGRWVAACAGLAGEAPQCAPGWDGVLAGALGQSAR